MDKKKQKVLEARRKVDSYLSKLNKQQREDLKKQVKICPCCGQPTCDRNDAEKYFKKE